MTATQTRIEDERSRSPAAGSPGHGGTCVRRAVATIAIVTLMASAPPSEAKERRPGESPAEVSEPGRGRGPGHHSGGGRPGPGPGVGPSGRGASGRGGAGGHGGGHGGRPGGGHGGFHGHGQGHGHGHGFRGGGGAFIGIGPWWWDPFWYYPSPYWYPPPSAVVDQSWGYVQRQPEPAYWYYCQSANAYYPSVPSCPEPWILVAPRSP
jgi:hypothetical protein